MKLRSRSFPGLVLAFWFLVIAALVLPAPANSTPLVTPEVPVWGRPGAYEVAVVRYTWKDARRQREIPVKIYYPVQGAGPFPVILFSHGLGGSREGYEYLGRQWASHGYVSVHLQHLGSDRAVWENSWSKLLALRQAAHNLQNSLNRPLDVSFALDQMDKLNQSKSPFQGRLDLSRVGAAGHSFGAYTTMAVAGQVFGRPGGRELSLADPRIKAAIPMSTPVPRKKGNLTRAYAKITIPCLHMTGTRDDSPIGETRAAERRLPFDYTKSSDQYLVTFQNGDHMIFSDHQRLLSRGPQDARFHDLIRLSTTAFWDAYLKGEVAARNWLNNGGLTGALGAHATLEMKLPGRGGPAGFQTQ
jgi:predicted dienelactone hydrolase